MKDRANWLHFCYSADKFALKYTKKLFSLPVYIICPLPFCYSASCPPPPLGVPYGEKRVGNTFFSEKTSGIIFPSLRAGLPICREFGNPEKWNKLWLRLATSIIVSRNQKLFYFWWISKFPTYWQLCVRVRVLKKRLFTYKAILREKMKHFFL